MTVLKESRYSIVDQVGVLNVFAQEKWVLELERVLSIDIRIETAEFLAPCRRH